MRGINGMEYKGMILILLLFGYLPYVCEFQFGEKGRENERKCIRSLVWEFFSERIREKGREN